MVINALNSGAEVFMADFEDANTPKWDNNLQGHLNLCDAMRRGSTSRRQRGQAYRLNEDRHAVRAPARLAPAGEARPYRRPADFRRHLRLRAVLLPQRAASCSRAAAARISICPSWRAISKRGCGTTSSTWRRTTLGVPRGTIRATVLIETILAAFEMERDPVRAARALGRAQLRALGLHLLVHQEVAEQQRTSASPIARSSR